MEVKPTDELAARLDELDQEIQKVRSDVARFHHEGERHFIDQGSKETDPAVQASLCRLEELAKSSQAIERRVDNDNASAPQMKSRTRLRELQREIDQVRKAVEQFHHQGERHFIDE
jgi:uncharacterized coiled-coil DUF342 family protein